VTVPMLRSPASQELLRSLAAEMRLEESILLELLKAAEKQSGMLRRKGLYQAFDTIIDQAFE